MHGLFGELNDDLASCPREAIFGSSGIAVRTYTVITVKAFKRETKVEILLGGTLMKRGKTCGAKQGVATQI